jgi:myo-inositol-1(or 4)-monophosphatase
MIDIKDTAVGAARKAGALLKENLGRVVRVEYKGAVDLVTEMDKEAEALIISEIRKSFPDHGILTEESKEKLSPSPYRWIIDPLDGTTNYAHGFPVFSVSIAFEENGELLFGVVYSPMLDELFTVERGGGAYLNGNRIRVSATESLGESLLATGFPYDVRTSRANNLDHFSNFAVRAFRRLLGDEAPPVGRCNGFSHGKGGGGHGNGLQGGRVLHLLGRVSRNTDFRGGEFSIYSDECLATNGLIYDEMVEVLKMGLEAGRQGNKS